MSKKCEFDECGGSTRRAIVFFKRPQVDSKLSLTLKKNKTKKLGRNNQRHRWNQRAKQEFMFLNYQ